MAEGRGAVLQVLVAVAIALLVGSTAPWWWHDVKMLVTRHMDRVSEPAITNEDPEQTMRKLLAAWNNGDRERALSVAERSVADKIFSATSVKINTEEITCYVVGTGQRDCQIPHTKGILDFRLVKTDQGWWIESVEGL